MPVRAALRYATTGADGKHYATSGPSASKSEEEVVCLIDRISGRRGLRLSAPTAALLMSNMSIREKPDVLKAVVHTGGRPEVIRPDFQKSVKKIDDLMKVRHLVAHTTFFLSIDDEGLDFMVKSAREKVVHRLEHCTVKTAQDCVTRISLLSTAPASMWDHLPGVTPGLTDPDSIRRHLSKLVRPG